MTDQKKFGYKFNITRDVVSCKESGSTEDYSYQYLYTYHQAPDTIAYKTDEYPDIVSILDLPANSTAYVVYAVWSDGDSFGCSRYSSAEPFGIFKSFDCAKEFSSQLYNPVYDPNKSETSIVIDCSDGQRFEYRFFPWGDWFSDLEYVDVIQVTVKE